MHEAWVGVWPAGDQGGSRACMSALVAANLWGRLLGRLRGGRWGGGAWERHRRWATASPCCAAGGDSTGTEGVHGRLCACVIKGC